VSAIGATFDGADIARPLASPSDLPIEEIIAIVRDGFVEQRPRGAWAWGVALVDKPAGPSSFAIVAQIRRVTGARTGHAGTLDPFATGLLLLLSGRATKLAPQLVGLDKRYLTTIDLTATTTTGDPEGEIVERHEPPAALEVERLRREMSCAYLASAVKIDGEHCVQAAQARGGSRDASTAFDRACARRRRPMQRP
jgi:tRNA pseudouridine55 synthase